MKTERRFCARCGKDQEYQVLDGNETAELKESSHAVLWESSHAVLWESSHAELWGSSHAELWGSSHAVLRESSHAELWESSHAVLRGSSHAELRESSHAELRESSHAVLWGSSHAVLWGSSHAELSKFASAHIHGQKVHCKGGVQIKIPEIVTAKEWCEYYGVEINKKGVATLFKGVDDDFSTKNARVRGIFYKPGQKPQAPDWDGGDRECGGGLHFSPSAGHTLNFNGRATHFVACPVKVVDIVVHKNPQYPDKVKAKGVCKPIYEVDRYGKKLK